MQITSGNLLDIHRTFTGAKAKAEAIGAASGALLVMPPANTCPRHADNIFALTPCRAANSQPRSPLCGPPATVASERQSEAHLHTCRQGAAAFHHAIHRRTFRQSATDDIISAHAQNL